LGAGKGEVGSARLHIEGGGNRKGRYKKGRKELGETRGSGMS